MTPAYFLAGILATACVSLVIGHIRNDRAARDRFAAYEGQLELLRREKDTLLHTALEAKGVQVIDPQATQRIAATEPPMNLARRVATNMARLAAEDAAKAEDRDIQVAREIEERRREAEEIRRRIGVGASN